jgi:hypothetical protein
MEGKARNERQQIVANKKGFFEKHEDYTAFISSLNFDFLFVKDKPISFRFLFFYFFFHFKTGLENQQPQSRHVNHP